MIKPINRIATKQIAKFAQRKVPKYLYHITNTENLEKILKAGKLKVTDTDSIKGVYLLNLQNFFKRWNFNITEDLKNMHMGLGILMQAIKDDSKIVILKIPTKNLDAKKIKIRSQNKIFSLQTEYINHYKKGDKIQNSRHYLEKKDAIEYIFPKEINVSRENVIGETSLNFSEIYKVLVKNKKTQTKFFKKIMQNLLKNTPEAKNIDFLL